MSQLQPITPEDPRLTAYALGELEGAERDAVAAAVAASAPLQQQVEAIRAQAGKVEDAYALFNRVDGDAALFAQINRRLEEESAALRSGSAQPKWDETIPLRRPYLWWTPYALPAAATFVALLSVGALWLAGVRDGSGLLGVDAFANRTVEHAAFAESAIVAGTVATGAVSDNPVTAGAVADSMATDSTLASVASAGRQTVLHEAVAQKATAPALAASAPGASVTSGASAALATSGASSAFGAVAARGLSASANPAAVKTADVLAETTEMTAVAKTAPVALPGLLPTRDILAARRWAAQPQGAATAAARSAETVASALSRGQSATAVGHRQSDREAAVSSAAIAALPAEAVTIASMPSASSVPSMSPASAAADADTIARANIAAGADAVAALPPLAFARLPSAPVAAKATAARANTADSMAVSRTSRLHAAADAAASTIAESSGIIRTADGSADSERGAAGVAVAAVSSGAVTASGASANAVDVVKVMREAPLLVQPVAVVAETPPAPAPQLETLAIPVRPSLPLENADAAVLPVLSGPADNFDALMAAASAVMERRLSSPHLNSPRLSVAEQPAAVPLPPKLDLANAYVQLSLWIEAGQLPPPRQVDAQAVVGAMKSAAAADSDDAGAGAALEQAVRAYALVLHERPADASARLDSIAENLGADQRLLGEPQVSRFLSLLRETQKLLARHQDASIK